MALINASDRNGIDTDPESSQSGWRSNLGVAADIAQILSLVLPVLLAVAGWVAAAYNKFPPLLTGTVVAFSGIVGVLVSGFRIKRLWGVSALRAAAALTVGAFIVVVGLMLAGGTGATVEETLAMTENNVKDLDDPTAVFEQSADHQGADLNLINRSGGLLWAIEPSVVGVAKQKGETRTCDGFAPTRNVELQEGATICVVTDKKRLYRLEITDFGTGEGLLSAASLSMVAKIHRES